MRGDGYDQLLALWSIQEALLQAYRSIFITAESIVIGIAVAIAASSPISALVLAGLGLLLLWMWHRVCSERALDVSLVQWLLRRAEEGSDVSSPLSDFKKFQGGDVIALGGREVWRRPDESRAGKINDESYRSSTRSSTRLWMETRLPLVFLALWGFVAATAVWTITAT